ncbi:MAG: cation:proton antiporter [Planctomycetota bacterium]|nr:cation:proton antiporter [Planctomycetota bacterium]MDA1251297.1 cation:proton antiporter [Planctomycetota bacterium]
MELEWYTLISLGLMLGTALVGGQLARMAGVPRVTAYLLAGLLLGPHAFHLIEHDQLEALTPIARLAMALVLFNIGCQFTLVYFRKILHRAIRYSLGEIGLTFVLVGFGMLLVQSLAGEPVSWRAAFLLGVLALATAPATTILVLKENKSEGPVTEFATALVVFNNLAAVVLFEVMFLLIHYNDGHLGNSLPTELLKLAQDLVGSVALGFAGGLLASYGCAMLSQERWLILLIAISTLLLGMCGAFGVPYLLTFLAMGMTVANASDQVKEIGSELQRVTGLLCVLFFTIHGAELNPGLLFNASESSLLIIAGGYVLLRSAGKVFGIYIAARKDDQVVRRWLGPTLVAQAGAAVALASMAAADGEAGLGETGKQLQLVILSSVVIFELIGPILIQTSVIQAGEVPVSQVITRSATGPLEELLALINRLRVAFGFNPFEGRSASEITVGQVMRRNIKGIDSRAEFEEVLDYIEDSHINTNPVVNRDGQLVGVIRYSDLRDVLFDPGSAHLVRADDLAGPVSKTITPDAHLDEVWRYLRSGLDDCIPVLASAESTEYVGLIRRKDVLRYFARTADE